MDTPQQKPTIEYADFARLDMRLAKIVAAEPVEGADKLLKLTLDVGPLGDRIVASGIKAWYEPEALVGKTVVYLANLAPKMLRGVESQGMILAAGETDAILLLPDKDAPPGTPVR